MYTKSLRRELAVQFIGTAIFCLTIIALIGVILLPSAMLPETDPLRLGNGAFFNSLQREFGEFWRASQAALQAAWETILATFPLG